MSGFLRFCFSGAAALLGPGLLGAAPYVVVLDPGHGGRNISPVSIYGDKWNTLDYKYLDNFRGGTSRDGINEAEETYEIASRVQKILQLTETAAGRKQFYRILRRYAAGAAFPKGPVKAILSREKSYYSHYLDIREDMNAPYRLYDYPDLKTGQLKPGTISHINSLKPHLVVSIHLTQGGAPAEGGMAAVITPSFHTYKKLLDYSRADQSERQKIKAGFERGPYAAWFESETGRSFFEWFLCDSYIYFTGFWSEKNGVLPDLDRFRGYRHNMISWKYRDAGGWEQVARAHPPGSRYSADIRFFAAEGPFWEREKGQPEKWRRENGPEGFGGDNFYASQELLRYVRQGLLLHKKKSAKNLPALMPPYLSTWAVPTYMNAISAYLELAYINVDADYERILREKEVQAEALAVGIYSLFYSLPQGKGNVKKDLPRGKAVNFGRYEKYQGKNYFAGVVDPA